MVAERSIVSLTPRERARLVTNKSDTAAKANDSNRVLRRAWIKFLKAMIKYVFIYYSLVCMAVTGSMRVAMRAG